MGTTAGVPRLPDIHRSVQHIGSVAPFLSHRPLSRLAGLTDEYMRGALSLRRHRTRYGPHAFVTVLSRIPTNRARAHLVTSYVVFDRLVMAAHATSMSPTAPRSASLNLWVTNG